MPASAEPGNTFGRVAEAYARTRPPYSSAALERAASELGLASDATVLDLAAGTGNLTRALRERFARVIAVEPDDEMRAFADDALAGSAEAIPLDADEVDAVFVGEAFHWFDVQAALTEIRRVSRGGVAIMSRSWGEFEQPGLVPAAFKTDLDAIWAQFHSGPRDFPDWRDEVQPDGEERFTEIVHISGRDLVDLHLTGSTPASVSDVERAAVAERAYPLMDDAYEMRVVTNLYWKCRP